MKRFIITSLITSLFLAGSASADDFDKKMDAYLKNDANIEKLGSAIETYFQSKRKKQQQEAAKQEEKQLEEQFKNPIKIDVGNSYILGDPKAPITVVEFSDFQCPFCKRGGDTMKDLVEAYPKHVRVAFKHLPLPFHKQAKPASIAALAAGKQGKFWEMHDALFESQSRIAEGEAFFNEAAEKLKLDMAKFKKDMKDPKLAEIVDADMALGAKLGVRGTPGFFVNGVQVRGARPLPYFKTLVERWKKQLKLS